MAATSVTELRGCAPALLVVTLLAGACNLSFDPPSKLDELRILAVRASPPEARPGESVRFDALVYDPQAPGADAGGDTVSYCWRACFLDAARASFFGGGGGGMFGGSGAGEQLPSSCFDLGQSIPQEELLEQLMGQDHGASGGGAGGEDGEGGDQGPGDARDAMAALSELAIDLGEEPVVDLFVFPFPPFPAIPSFCSQLGQDERQEQGGREIWVGGLRLMVSLRLSQGGRTIYSNKRLVMRPAAELIPDELQGLPFRTPQLCATAADAEQCCGRNLNPDPPGLTTPNGEWSGQGPLRAKPGQQIKLRPVLPEPGDQQVYVSMKGCGQQMADPQLRAAGGEYERKEARFYSWFSDHGEIVVDSTVIGEQEGDRESAWRAPKEPGELPGEHHLYVVARDGRGGVSWTVIPLEVRD